MSSDGNWTPTRTEFRKLTADERATYDEQGYVLVPDVFDQQEIDSINAEVDRLRDMQAEENALHKNFIFKLGLRSPVTQSRCAEPRVLTLIEDIVQPGISIYSAKMVEKPPFDETVCHWHQDNAYYNQKVDSECRMSIWLPLQDTDESNGGLWVVPGSHKGGTREAEQFKDGVCALAFADGREAIDGAIPVSIKAGDVLLFHADLWHRSLGNKTEQTRRSFIVSYQEGTISRGNADQYKLLRPAS